MPITVPIPGGQATLRDPNATPPEITAGGRRIVQVTLGRLNRATVRAILATSTVDADAAPEVRAQAEKAAEEAWAVLTEEEHARVLGLPDATICSLLSSWTIERPLPKTPTAVSELPVDLYDALYDAVQRLQGAVVDSSGPDVDPFSVGAVEDPDSPTGASVALNVPSATEAAPSENSTPKSPPGSPSTSTEASSAA